MKARAILFSLLLTVSFTDCFSQKEWSNWYYNGTHLLTFKNGYAQPLTNFINPKPAGSDFFNFYWTGPGGDLAYSDPLTGKMKFIISNGHVYDSSYHMLPQPNYLWSCGSDYANSYHIIPFHNDPHKFYIIQFQDDVRDLLQSTTNLQVRCTKAVGLAYSILDLSANNGAGGFTVLNYVIASGLSGQMTTVRAANGKDVWVIAHIYGSNQFLAWLFTDSGIKNIVESDIGPDITGGYLNAGGTLTASHDGKLLAGATSLGSVQLFDFNTATGVLSNYRELPHEGVVGKLQFSPDNSKLYYLSSNTRIYQYDFNSTDLASSLTKVVDEPQAFIFDMQLAPDGKIYVTKTFNNDDLTEYTGAIECPNLSQFACNFNPKALNSTQVTFPDLINDFINESKEAPVTKLDLGNDTAVCFGELKITAPPGWESYRWNTGDTTQQITVKKAGTYYVLTGNTGFSCPEAYGYINVSDKAVKLNLGPDSTLCPGTYYGIHIDSSYNSVLWENGSNVKDSVLKESTTLIVSANDLNGCFTNDTVSINFLTNPKADFGPDTTLCNNESLVLQLLPKPDYFGPSGVYLWQDGSQNDTFKVTQPGLYWGQSTFQNCTVRDSIIISYINATSVYLGSDTTFLCEGDSLRLNVNTPAENNTWSNGQKSSSIMVRQQGTYWVKVDNGSCTVSDTINISYQSKPYLFLGNDTSVCDRQKITLVATPGNAKYLWQDNSTAQSLEVYKPGLYWAEVTSGVCSVSDSIMITYKPLPEVNLGNDTSICVNDVIKLNAANPLARSYTWQDTSHTPSFMVNKAGLYYVSLVGLNGCKNSDSINVTTKPLPEFSLGNDTTLCEAQSLLLTEDMTNADYLWNTGDRSNSLLVAQPGTFWLEVTQNGCEKRDSIIVSYKPMPVVYLGRDTTMCEGNSLVLNATNNNASYLWQDGSREAVQEVNNSGLYYVTVDLNGCKRKDSVLVNYLKKPAFTLGHDTTLCTGETITLAPSIANVSYSWQDGSDLPDYTVTAPGVYQLTATNVCGSTTEHITITAGLCQLYMPNAFTPNEDGINDLFRVKYPGFIKTFEMEVYNRFGQVVFKSVDPRTGWDGMYKGEPQPAGIYVWKIILTGLDGIKQFAKGTVQLIR